MRAVRTRCLTVALLVSLPLVCVRCFAEDLPSIEFQDGEDRLIITLGGKPLAEYLKSGDDRTTRPFLRHLHAPTGEQVSRNHPPPAGEPDDHDTFHAGMFMGFGRMGMGKYDTWRLKNRVQFSKYVEQPTGGPGKGSFAVKNRFLKSTSKDAEAYCTSVDRYTFLVRPYGTLILLDVTFTADSEEIEFGDQEEMGLAIRVNAPMNVAINQTSRPGREGRILNARGDKNQDLILKRNREEPVEWCDYAGWVNDRFVGVLMMGHPENFSKPYWMARDYGLLVCNPFASGDLGKGKTSTIRVQQGETFRIQFGSYLHSTENEESLDLPAAYEDYLSVAGASVGIVSITQGPPDLPVPPDVPAGEYRRYGLGFAFQVGPSMAGLFCNRRIGPGDHEDGSDLFLFDSLGAIKAENAIPVTRNESRVNPANGQREAGQKFPTSGGFVPLGARRADGSPHPHAGSGFGVCGMVTHLDSSPSGTVLGESLQLQQFSYDGQQFRILRTSVTWGRSGLQALGSDWILTQPGLCMAIPDGDDLLYPALARNSSGGASGVSRWQRRDGNWQPVGFMPVINSGMEPTLIRDTDGSLLFCTRGEEETPYAIRVRRSTDGGQSWNLIVDKPDTVGHNPIAINRAVDGAVYVICNPMKEDHSYSREVLNIWPLNRERCDVGPPLMVRDGPAEFGPVPSGITWKLDHATSANLRLGDGQWHHIFVFRVLDRVDPDPRPPCVGCYVEEVTCAGPPLPEWNLAGAPRRAAQ